MLRNLNEIRADAAAHLAHVENVASYLLDGDDWSDGLSAIRNALEELEILNEELVERRMLLEANGCEA